LQPGQFSSPERNLTIHIRDRTYNGELRGILLQDARDAEQTMAYLADRGVLMKQDESTFLVMFDGHIVRKTDDNEAPQIVTFESYAIDLNRFEPKSEGVVLKPRERYFSDLAWPDPDDPYARHRPGHLDRGVLMKQDESTFLVMFDGHIVRKTDDNEAPQIVTFESYAIDLNRFEPKSEGVVLKPRERYFSDLAWPDPDDPYARHRPGH